jgi:nitrate reductase molybdenum cofactor assembly chaperone
MDWMEAARKSPVRRLIQDYKVALPLHPEYRTMPMVWYVPPLSPVVDVVKDTGHDAEEMGNLFGAIDALRIPVEYLAGLFTAGDIEPVNGVLRKLAAMRSYMRDINLGRDPDASIPRPSGWARRRCTRCSVSSRSPSTTSATSSPPRTPSRRTASRRSRTDCAVSAYDHSGDAEPFGVGSGPEVRIAVEDLRIRTARMKGRRMTALIDRVWKRHRRAEPSWASDDVAATWQLVSLLLDYPTDDLVCRAAELASVAAALPPALGGGLTAYLSEVEATDLGVLQRDYVDTFDVTRKCALHLTYATCGDTRRRGVALVQFKQAFRASGVELDDADAELPDYLPIVLEFAALTDREAGWKLLTDHRVSIELLHRALAKRKSRWLPVVESLRATLPVLDGTDEEALARLIAAGPPSEEVGIDGALDPYVAVPQLVVRPTPSTRDHSPSDPRFP